MDYYCNVFYCSDRFLVSLIIRLNEVSYVSKINGFVQCARFGL